MNAAEGARERWWRTAPNRGAHRISLYGASVYGSYA